MKFRDGSAVHDFIQKGFEYMNGDKARLIKTILYSTLRVLSHSVKGTHIADAEEVSSHFMEEILNMGKRINGNQYNCQYSPRTLRIAMAICSRSKTAYMYLRESNLVMLPCPRTLSMKIGRTHQ